MISIIIPTIPPRVDLLARAIESVERQTYRSFEILTMPDLDHEGPAVIRNRLLDEAKGDFVAFLDDDDAFLPNHLAALVACQAATNADYVYPWYQVMNRAGRVGHDPMPAFFGKPWDNAQPHQTTIVTLVRAELAKRVRFTPGNGLDPNGSHTVVGGEDYRFTLGCMKAGAKIVHHPERTWLWYHHGKNTSGMPDRWT